MYAITNESCKSLVVRVLLWASQIKEGKPTASGSSSSRVLNNGCIYNILVSGERNGIFNIVLYKENCLIVSVNSRFTERKFSSATSLEYVNFDLLREFSEAVHTDL